MPSMLENHALWIEELSRVVPLLSGSCVFPSCAWRVRVCETSIAEDHKVRKCLARLRHSFEDRRGDGRAAPLPSVEGLAGGKVSSH